VQPADFDKNGRSDFFLLNSNGIWYRVTNSNTGFTYVSGGWRPGWATTIVDLNGDGRSDVFLFDPLTREWYQAVATPSAFAYTAGKFTR
jgi:hypothetical protein